MRKSLVLLRALGTLLAPLALTPAPAPAADTIVVSAAASLKDAFEEIGELYASSAGESRPAFNFGASGDLVAQIRGGAPVDVFAAASAKDMDGLEAEGALLPGTRTDFASNEIVLVVPAASTAGISSFMDLAKPGVERIAIVNPKTSPAGRYTGEIFASLGVSDAVRPHLILAETVRQALDYTSRGEVDAGVVYATDAAMRPREVKVVAAAPAGSHQPVTYPIAVLRGAAHPAAAESFAAAVRSAAGQAILARYGFKPAPGAR
jgi:molybdate transport system substrate-binding protein